MEVNLKLYGSLKRYDSSYELNNNLNLKIDSFKSIKQILKGNNIPIKEVSFILKGSKIVNLNYQVQNGDVIKIFSRIVGG